MSAPQLVRYDGRPRLLGGWFGTGRPATLADHHATHGALPLGAVPHLVDLVGAAGLRGRGGAWFPTARKLATVRDNAAGGDCHVVVNGAESEPAAGKDKLLLRAAPHLVLDGAELAALAIGARKVTVCVHRGTGIAAGISAAVAERTRHGWGGQGVTFEVMEPPRWYVSSESTALANYVGGGVGKPRDVSAYREGVGGRPTLVSNTETFAHLALIARHGPEWYRAAGTGDAPGTALFTVSGAVAAGGVYELPVGVTGEDVLRVAGGATEHLRAVLIGGYGGSWLPPEALRLPLTPEALKPHQASPGAGVLVALPARACGLVETVRVAAWLASQNARQCGPCFNGLPAIADDLARITWGRDTMALDRLRFRMGMVNGRGACAHPDGVIKLVGTALRVFDDCVRAHLAGRFCAGMYRPPMLPVPAPLSANEGWR
jgi:NADH:ubiquinone oxidoreductase subunit F (NADH-binding)